MICYVFDVKYASIYIKLLYCLTSWWGYTKKVPTCAYLHLGLPRGVRKKRQGRLVKI